MSAMNNSKTGTVSFLRRLFGGLFDPSPAVHDAGDRRRSQVLAIFSVLLAVSFLLGNLFTPADASTLISRIVFISGAILFGIAYILSRTTFFNWGSWIIVACFSFAPFAIIFGDMESDSLTTVLSFLPIAYVITSLLLPRWGLTVVVVSSVSLIFALPYITEHITEVVAWGAGGIIATLGLLLLIVNTVQRAIEKARLGEIQASNAELESLRNSLEGRVQARTQELVQTQLRTEALLGELDEASRIAQIAGYELDVAQQLLIFNDRFYALLGTSAAEEGSYALPIDEALKRFVHPEDTPRLAEDIDLIGQQQMEGDLEYQFLHTNGEIRTFSFRFIVDTDASHEPTRVHGVVQDITESKVAERALREVESVYRQAIASADAVPYSRRYQDETFTFMGEKIYEILGYKSEEVTASFFDSLVEEVVIHSSQKEFEDAVSEARDGTLAQWKADYRLRTRDGEFRWVADTSVEIEVDGRSAGSVGIMFDITERKLAAEEQNKRAADLETITELATAISVISEPQAMLQTVVDLTKASFQLYHAHIYLINEERATLELAAGADSAGRSMVEEGHAIALSHPHSIVARAARMQEGVVENNIIQTGDFLSNPLLPDTRSELAVPIIAGLTFLGVLDIQSDYVGAYTDTDIRIQTILAAQVAVALQNAQVRVEMNQAIADLDMYTRRLTAENWEAFFERRDAAKMGYVLDDGTIKVKAGDTGSLEDAGFVQPLLIGGEKIGQIVAGEGEMEADDVEAVLTAVSQGLGAHLENLRLNEQTEQALADSQRRSEELVLINEVVSAVSASFDIQESLTIIVDSLVENTSADQARIALINPESTSLIVTAESFDPNQSTSAMGLAIPIIGNILAERAIETRQSQIVDDPQHDPIIAHLHNFMEEQGVEQLLVVPMVVSNEVIGTLGIDILTKNKRFNEDELRLAETLVFQIASAIQNARLFEQVQARARQEQILREVTARVYAAPDTESVLRTAAQEVSRVLGVETAVYLNSTSNNPVQDRKNGK